MENSHDDKRSATWICFSLIFATMSRATLNKSVEFDHDIL
jgi:hypothetical protein